MHIELTDHLRCPEDHEEGYLILLPEQMLGRRVLAGVLACPACGWQTAWTEGVPRLGLPWVSQGEAPLPADAVPPMLGIEGAGGWLALGGSAGLLAEALSVLLPGVAIVAINPPASVHASEAISVMHSRVWPIKSHAVRGAVLGADAEQWRDAAAQSLLPGRQLIGVGRKPEAVNLELLAVMASLWVIKRR